MIIKTLSRTGGSSVLGVLKYIHREGNAEYNMLKKERTGAHSLNDNKEQKTPGYIKE